ncbi:ATP-grasp enzyme-like protein [hydrothermal vent metagenome]|uniref:ATP-grasp enzyme-like protein n=1 Tax=hydrothermal vent metagenome TaxID=652676 RepID=A0A3B0XXW5_9ZZZZ
MNVFVTDGNSRAALAITRSLGRKGHHVIVGCKRSTSLSSCSRYCADSVSYPDPACDSEAFIQHLKILVEEYSIDLLVPVTDVCVLPVSKHREQFSSRLRIPLPPDESLRIAADKNRLIEIATTLGVSVPKSFIVDNPENIIRSLYKLDYPLVIKPSRSRVPDKNGWISTSVDYAETPGELEEKLCKMPTPVFPIILQERIVGPGIGLFYCYHEGKKIASFAHQRLREKPPSGGVSVLRESVDIDPVADGYSQILLENLNWHGVAMVEFKRDLRDGQPKLMEINGRFWGSLQLAVDSGVDFPAILAMPTSDQPDTKNTNNTYEVGIRSRWLWGDIDLLLMYLFKSSRQLNLPPGAPSRWKSLRKILNPFGHNLHYEVLRFSDLKPWLHETMQWFRN